MKNLFTGSDLLATCCVGHHGVGHASALDFRACCFVICWVPVFRVCFSLLMLFVLVICCFCFASFVFVWVDELMGYTGWSVDGFSARKEEQNDRAVQWQLHMQVSLDLWTSAQDYVSDIWPAVGRMLLMGFRSKDASWGLLVSTMPTWKSTMSGCMYEQADMEVCWDRYRKDDVGQHTFVKASLGHCGQRKIWREESLPSQDSLNSGECWWTNSRVGES